MIAVLPTPHGEPTGVVLSPEMVALLVRLSNVTTRLEKVVERLDKDGDRRSPP